MSTNDTRSETAKADFEIIRVLIRRQALRDAINSFSIGVVDRGSGEFYRGIQTAKRTIEAIMDREQVQGYQE